MLNKRNISYITLAAIVLIVAALSILSFNPGNKVEPAEGVAGETIIPDPVLIYGIPVDSFRLEEISVKKNEMLSNILLARGINYQQIDELARKSRSIFDVRKIKAGNPITFFWTKDSLPVVRYFVYEKNLEEFITYTICDSLKISEGKKEVTYAQREVSGEIESNLWNSMLDNDVSPKLALDLSDVYQWTIDFFGLQKGDSYRVVYEVKMIDGNAIGINRVIASSFNHAGRDHWAFAFEQNGRMEYFDEDGQSLRRAFLKAPLKFSRISSGYSNSRFHPILKIYRPHRGVDYAASAGTPVQTIGDGKVVKVAYDRASGHYIKIRHNGIYTSGYMHLQRRPSLKTGDYVKQGDIIGNVGATGYATGPHLDFRIWQNGQLVNPSTVESPPVEPVAQENRSRFDSIASVYRSRIEGISAFITALSHNP